MGVELKTSLLLGVGWVLWDVNNTKNGAYEIAPGGSGVSQIAAQGANPLKLIYTS